MWFPQRTLPCTPLLCTANLWGLFIISTKLNVQALKLKIRDDGLLILTAVLYCGCFNLFCNVCVSVCGPVWKLCGCFGNVCTYIYCVSYCLYCVFVLLRLRVFILICFMCTAVRTIASEWKLNCSNNNNNNNLAGCTMFPHLPGPIWQLYYLLPPFASVIPVIFH